MNYIYVMTENGLDLIKTSTSNIWTILELFISIMAILASGLISFFLFKKDKIVSNRAMINIDEIEKIGLNLEGLVCNNKEDYYNNQVRILGTYNYEEFYSFFKTRYEKLNNEAEQLSMKKNTLRNSRYIKIENIGPGNAYNCDISVDVEVHYTEIKKVEVVNIEYFLPFLKENEECFFFYSVLPYFDSSIDDNPPNTIQSLKKVKLTYRTVYNEEITLINEYGENSYTHAGFHKTQYEFPLFNKFFEKKQRKLFYYEMQDKKISWKYPLLYIPDDKIMETIRLD